MAEKTDGLTGRLIHARELTGYTQYKLAEIGGLPKSSVSQFESGRRVPSINSLRKLAIGLGVTSDYLLGIEERNI